MDGDIPGHMDFPVALLEAGTVWVPEEQSLRTLRPKGGEILLVLICHLFFLFFQGIEGSKDNRAFEERAKLCVIYDQPFQGNIFVYPWMD